LKGDLSGNSPKLNSLVINPTATAVIPSSGSGATFRNPTDAPLRRTPLGTMGSSNVYRIEVTGYRAKTVNKVSQFRRSNKVYLVPFEQLSAQFQRIHAQGGVIASVTVV
jgi:phycoerythrin-associated linker protein